MIINTVGMLCILPVFVKSWMAKLAHLIHLQKLYVASNNVKQPIISYTSYSSMILASANILFLLQSMSVERFLCNKELNALIKANVTI